MGGGCLSDSVGYLLDSHVLLWWWFDPDRLSGPVQSLSLKHHQGKCRNWRRPLAICQACCRPMASSPCPLPWPL